MRFRDVSFLAYFVFLLACISCNSGTEKPDEPSSNIWVCCYMDSSFYAEEEKISSINLDGVEFDCTTENGGSFIRTQCDLSGGEFHADKRCKLGTNRFQYFKETVDPASYTEAEAQTYCNGKDNTWESF